MSSVYKLFENTASKVADKARDQGVRQSSSFKAAMAVVFVAAGLVSHQAAHAQNAQDQSACEARRVAVAEAANSMFGAGTIARGAGAVLGGVAGNALGKKIGAGDFGRFLSTAAGALAGGKVADAAVDHSKLELTRTIFQLRNTAKRSGYGAGAVDQDSIEITMKAYEEAVNRMWAPSELCLTGVDSDIQEGVRERLEQLGVKRIIASNVKDAYDRAVLASMGMAKGSANDIAKLKEIKESLERDLVKDHAALTSFVSFAAQNSSTKEIADVTRALMVGCPADLKAQALCVTGAKPWPNIKERAAQALKEIQEHHAQQSQQTAPMSGIATTGAVAEQNALREKLALRDR